MILNQFVNNGTDELLSKSLSSRKETTNNTRVIKIRGEKEFLDKIEAMLGYMQFLGDAGHSTSFKVSIDGDGRFSVDIKDESGKSLSSKWSDITKLNYDKYGDVTSFDFD